MFSGNFLAPSHPGSLVSQNPSVFNGCGVSLTPVRNRRFSCFYHVLATFVLHDVAHQKNFFDTFQFNTCLPDEQKDPMSLSKLIGSFLRYRDYCLGTDCTPASRSRCCAIARASAAELSRTSLSMASFRWMSC